MRSIGDRWSKCEQYGLVMYPWKLLFFSWGLTVVGGYFMGATWH